MSRNEILKRRRGMMGAKGANPRIPSEYQEVEWIGYNTSGNGFDTDILLTDTLYVEAEIAKIALPESNSGTVFPSMHSGTGTSSTYTKWGTLENMTGSSWSCSPQKEKTDLFDKTLFRSVKTTATGSGNTSLGYGSAKFCPELQFYSLKVFGADDVLLFNGVPCYRKSDNKIGMYDLVTDNFIACINTWQKGADV